MNAIFRWLWDAELADAISGDLEEERRARARQSRARAACWFWWRSLKIAAFLAGTKMMMSIHLPGRGLGRDVRHALRALRRSPWYAVTVTGVIAVGMALATTVFAVVDGVLFRPLPLPASRELVAIEPGVAGVDFGREIPSASEVDIANWRAAAPEVAITGYRAQRWAGMGEGVNEPPAGVALIDQQFFDTIGVHPAVGGFVPDDFLRDAPVRPMIVTDALWHSRFGARPDIVGQSFIDDPMQGAGFRVVGVMPKGFVFPSSYTRVDFLAPRVVAPDRAHDPTMRSVTEVIARVPAGLGRVAFQSQLEAGLAATRAVFPARGAKPATWSERFWRSRGPYDTVAVVPLETKVGRRDRPMFVAIFAAAAVLLLLGGLNVSGLMAAHGMDRARELALRRALGASAWHIARLVFVEAATPIAIGSAAGLAVAVPLVRVVARLLPDELVLLRPQAAPSVDWRVAAFVAVAAALVALPAALWPVVRALRIGRVDEAASGGRGSTRARSMGRDAVIAAQVAAALVLTLGGALLVGSLLAVYAHQPAVRTDGIVAVNLDLRGPGLTMNRVSPERTARVNRVLDAIKAVPGVDGAATTEAQVLVGGGSMSWFVPPPAARNSRLLVGVHGVSADFYRVLEPQLVSGRFPTDAELAVDAPVIVVSEMVARTYWAGQSPLGQTLDDSQDGKTLPFTVVGVVKDVRWNSWDDEVASIYGPAARLGRFPFPTVFIKSRAPVGDLIAAVDRAIKGTDPLMRMSRAGSFAAWFADTVRERRFQSWLFGSFACAALAIVGAGILGLIAMSTARRTREMGVRLALGATPDGLVRLIVREQALSVSAGLAAGGVLSYWLVRYVKSYLYEVTPHDPRVWAAAIGVILATALVGTLIPSWRTSRTDPVTALRVD